MSKPPDTATAPSGKARELRTFLFLTVVLFPALAIGFVGGLGLIIWIYQMFAGPPGPPGM